MEKLKSFVGAVIGFVRSNRILSIGIAAVILTPTIMAFFSGDTVTRDYSKFEAYSFKQTHGLGFCGDPDRPYSANIVHLADGTLGFSHSVLVLAGTDPEQCEGGTATNEGCFRPEEQPQRQLSQIEADQVAAVFAQTTYHKSPDPICREYGIDPCMIERHAWDGEELSDYICASNRLSAEQDAKLQDLLIDLQSGG